MQKNLICKINLIERLILLENLCFLNDSIQYYSIHLIYSWFIQKMQIKYFYVQLTVLFLRNKYLNNTWIVN